MSIFGLCRKYGFIIVKSAKKYRVHGQNMLKCVCSDLPSNQSTQRLHNSINVTFACWPGISKAIRTDYAEQKKQPQSIQGLL